MIFPKLAKAIEDFPPCLYYVYSMGGAGSSGAFDDPTYDVAPGAVKCRDFTPKVSE